MTDKELKQHVEAALEFEPSLNATWVVVSADDGVITLRGNVGSYAEKMTAERVALKVFGVKALANDLAVHVPGQFQRTDTKIAQAALEALKWSTIVPDQRVTLVVSHGWITLDGTVDWQFQKDAASRALHALAGVTGVTNNIVVRPPAGAADISEKIEAAFKRSATMDARRISVAVDGAKIVLRGNVRSWAERREAERTAWSAPGVEQVDDQLAVVP
jgi:osmotically-inducible protein OsmY